MIYLYQYTFCQLSNLSRKRFVFIFHHLRLPCESGGLRSYHILNQFLEHRDTFDEIILLVPSIDTLTGQDSYLYKHRKKNLFSNVKIIFIKSFRFDKANGLQRYISFIIYSLICCFKVISINRCSGYLCTTYSLPVLLMTSIVSKIHNSFLFVETRDLFLHGYLSILGPSIFNSFLKYLIYIAMRLESICLRSASLIFPNSPGFVLTLINQYKITPDKIKCVLLGIDEYPNLYQIKPPASENFCSLIHKILEQSSQFQCNLVYCGSLDRVHSPAPLIQLCNTINRRSLSIGIHLFGPSKSHLDISNSFHFVQAYGNISKATLSRILSEFDCGLYFGSETFPFNAILGNKIFDYISAKIPTIFLTQSFAFQFSEENNIGFKVDPLTLDQGSIDFICSFAHKNKSHLASCSDRLKSSTLCQILVEYILEKF